MTDRAGLDIGLVVSVSSGAGVLDLSRRLPSRGGRSMTIGADGKRDDQRKLSTGWLGIATLVGEGMS